MKFNQWILGLACLGTLALTPAVSQAQTGPGGTNAVSVTTNAIAGVNSTTFFDSAATYLTDFNTNFTWTGVSLEAATGYKQVTGVGATSVLDVQYDFATRWNAGLAFQFSGVGSPVNAVQAQGGYALIQHYDAKVDFDLRAGYDWTVHGGEVEPLVMIEKKLTPNTFLKTGIGLPVFFKGTLNRNPTFYLETGFTY